MSSEAAAQLIEQTDRALKGAEDETIDRIYRTLDTSYKQLERELLKAYEQQSGNLSLLPNQRKVVILEQVKNLLSLIDPKASKQLQKEFESLLSNASEQGRSLSESLVKAIANEPLKSFVGVPIEALRFQAEDGVKRLSRHGEEFASRASAVVEMGLIQGWGSRKVASQLRAELGVTKGRAESIARTETASAQNSAIEANLKANNFELFQVFATIGERTCFPAGTLVRTDKGDQPIEQIRVGDKVLTRQGFKRVNDVMCRDYAGKLTQVKAGNLSVTSTADHPFWTHRGWIEAQHMGVGDVVQTFNQERIQVDCINHFKLTESQRRPAMPGKIGGFASIPPSVLMPVSTVSLNRQTIAYEGKIDRVSTKSILLNKVEIQPFERFPNQFFKGGFSGVLTVAGHATEPSAIACTRANPEYLLTGRTGNFNRRATALLRAVMTIPSSVLQGSFMQKLFTAALAVLSDRVFSKSSALLTARFIAILHSSADAINLLANRAGFFYKLYSLSIAFARAKLSRPTCITTESFITNFASSLYLSLFLPRNGRTGKRAVDSALLQKNRISPKPLAAHRANSVSVLFGSSTSLRGSLTLSRAIPSFFSSAGLDEKCFLTNLTTFRNRHFNSSDVANTCNYSSTVKVYNLSVEGLPEYFANGILVHNCSTCAYRNQQVYKLGEPSPPYHVRCRCVSTPARQEWLEAGLIDVTWSQKYREDGLAELAEQGKQPNTGISPFEKAAGLTAAPKPVWKPGDKIQPTQARLSKTKDKAAATPKPSKADRSKDTIPDLETAKKKFRLLGSGIDGEVFLDTSTDPPRALKYRSNQSAPEYEENVLENMRRAGEMGIAPKLLGVYPDQKAFAMEYMEGFETGIHPRGKVRLENGKEVDIDSLTGRKLDQALLPYDRAFIATLKIAHDNQMAIDDLHGDNVMLNPTTRTIRFIDQGGSKPGSSNQEIAEQLLDRYSWRPLVAETIGRMANSLDAKSKRELQQLQRAWNNRDEKPISEDEAGRMVAKVYALLGID